MMKRVFAGLALAAFLGAAITQAQTAGSIAIEKPFTRATPGGSQVAAGYMTIVNKGAATDRLVAISSPAADKVQVHEMAMTGGIMKMRELPDGLTIEPGKTVSLAPGGYHLMIMGLKAPLKAGDTLPLTLTFEKAGKVEVAVPVLPIGGGMPDHTSMPGMKM